MPISPAVTTVRHGRSELALHHLRDGEGRPLLLLHGLGESSPATVPAQLTGWPGPVLALDLTGHGASTRPAGGGYTAEILLGDVDAALAQIGQVTLLGRGLGAYIALLAAGARPDLVRGAILTDGPGLTGGGGRPSSPFVLRSPDAEHAGPDPFVLFELSRDVRPDDYAVEFMRLIADGSDLPTPLAVCTIVRPEWLAAVIEDGGGRVADIALDAALELYGRS